MWNNSKVTHVSEHTLLFAGLPLPADNRHVSKHTNGLIATKLSFLNNEGDIQI
jgi:hypothetical protein